MDIDHESEKHDVPPSTVKGEARRAAAEDPSGDIKDVLEDAKDVIDPGPDSDRADPPSGEEPTGEETTGRSHR